MALWLSVSSNIYPHCCRRFSKVIHMHACRTTKASSSCALLELCAYPKCRCKATRSKTLDGVGKQGLQRRWRACWTTEASSSCALLEPCACPKRRCKATRSKTLDGLEKQSMQRRWPLLSVSAIVYPHCFGSFSKVIHMHGCWKECSREVAKICSRKPFRD